MYLKRFLSKFKAADLLAIQLHMEMARPGVTDCRKAVAPRKIEKKQMKRRPASLA
jgi:hypothetical protein